MARIRLFAVFAIAIVAALLLTRPRPTLAAPNTIDAVAVLPFTNDDPQTQHLSDGLTEILIDTLAKAEKILGIQ